MRIRKKKWALKEIENSNQVIKQDFDYDWEKHFNNKNKICLELGCGKGKFINQMAKLFPEKNFIAIEKYLYIIATGVRLANNSLKNLVFIIDDIKNIQKYFYKTKVSCIYINFCDPWPKKKHAKRRLTHSNFLEIYKKILEPDGKIYFKTDNLLLFEFTLNEFLNNNWHLKNISLDLHKTKSKNKNIIDKNIMTEIMTEYEKKFFDMGMPIYYCEASIKLNEIN